MERDLVLQAQSGDQQAFARLVGDSIERLYRVARLIIHDDDAARDGVQEALIAAWIGLPGLRDPDRFEAWLHRLLVRECLRLANRGRRNAAIEMRVRPVRDAATPNSSELLEMRDQIESGFRRLQPDTRAVLVLHYFLDLGDADGAEALGVPLGTYRSRLSRAKQSLRAALAADDRSMAVRRESLT
jgi:RNA polymerase sigma-70 factor (ECF subfamily)